MLFSEPADDLVFLASIRPAWQQDAACRGLDTKMFYPPKGGSAWIPSINKAKAMCQSCPVQSDCLDMAVANKDVFGIWGGTTGYERKGSGWEFSELDS